MKDGLHRARRFSGYLACLTLMAILSWVPEASAQKIIKCPDGDHREIDIREIAIQYQATRMEGTLSGLVILGGRIAAEPKTLQQAAVATQKMNEFIKALVVGFNSCVITKKDYQEAMNRLYPDLGEDAVKLEQFRKGLLEGQKVNQKQLQELLQHYEHTLRNFARISGKDIDYDRITAIVQETHDKSTERILRSQEASRVEQSEGIQEIIKRIELLERRQSETPLAKPAKVNMQISAMKQQLLAKADEAEAAYNKGYELMDRYRFAEAVPYLERALSAVKLPDFYAALGQAYWALTDFGKAEKVLREGLAQLEEKPDETKGTKLGIMLGFVLQSKGDLDEALRYAEQAIRVDEKVSGPDHQDVARDANLIGLILGDKRDLDGALKYHQRALKIDEKVYGSDHLDVARDANNIGMALCSLGSYEEALKYVERARNIVEKLYGPDHSKVALSIANIGVILQAKGDRDGALEKFEQALKIQEKVFGPGRADIPILAELVEGYRQRLEMYSLEHMPQEWALTHNKLGDALQQLGMLKEGGDGAELLGRAATAYRQALKVYSREDRPQLWEKIHIDLGIALLEQGVRTEGQAGSNLLAEAVIAYRQALQADSLQHIPQQWARIQTDLGVALLEQGVRTEGQAGRDFLAQAVTAQRQALKVTTRESAPQEWAITNNNLGIALKEQGMRTEGLAGSNLLAEAVIAYRQALQADSLQHKPPRWAHIQNDLCIALREQGIRIEGPLGGDLLAQAEIACRKALEVYSRKHMPRQWASAQYDLGNVLEKIANRTDNETRVKVLLSEAAACYEKVLEVFPGNLNTYKQASFINHEVLFRFETAYALRINWVENQINTISILADLTEASFTTARFSECAIRIQKHFSDYKTTPAVAILLHAIEIANLLALRNDDQVPDKLAKLYDDTARQPENFEVGRSFSGIKYFISQNEKLATHREWLQKLFNALEEKGRDSILSALEDVRMQYRKKTQ